MSRLYERIVDDLTLRERLGVERYGIGIEDAEKDWLIEAYEEALDLVVYLRRAIDDR